MIRFLEALAEWLKPPLHDATHATASAIGLIRSLAPPVRPIPRCVACEKSFVQESGAECHRCEALRAREEESEKPPLRYRRGVPK